MITSTGKTRLGTFCRRLFWNPHLPISGAVSLYSVLFDATGPAALRSVSLPPSFPLWVSVRSKARTSRPGVTFLECLTEASSSREDDGLHTTRLYRRPGPGCSGGPHGGERAVRAGGPRAADQHRKSERGFQDGPGDENYWQHRRPR